MADYDISIDSIRKEINSLRSEIEKATKNLADKQMESGSEALKKVMSELEHYRNIAKHQAERAYDVGHEQVENASKHICANPFLSLLIAFGAGCILSCLFKHYK